MGQITVEKNVGGIEGLCVITPTVHATLPASCPASALADVPTSV